MSVYAKVTILVLVGIFGFMAGSWVTGLAGDDRLAAVRNQLDVATESGRVLAKQNSELSAVNSRTGAVIEQLKGNHTAAEKDIRGLGESIADSLKIVRRLQEYFRTSQSILFDQKLGDSGIKWDGSDYPDPFGVKEVRKDFITLYMGK